MGSGGLSCSTREICLILIFQTALDSGLLWRVPIVALINALKSERKAEMHGHYVTFQGATSVFLLLLGIFR